MSAFATAPADKFACGYVLAVLRLIYSRVERRTFTWSEGTAEPTQNPALTRGNCPWVGLKPDTTFAEPWPRNAPWIIPRELLEEFAHNGLVNEYLVSVLPDAIWHAAPPGGRGRTIAAIVAHMQSVRRMFARMGGARPGPPSLDRMTVTRAQARRALRQSTIELSRLFEAAIAGGRSRVTGMPRRVINMLMYLVQHDAHHRGQIFMVAKALGHEFRTEDVTRVWGWKTLPSKSDGS